MGFRTGRDRVHIAQAAHTSPLFLRFRVDQTSRRVNIVASQHLDEVNSETTRLTNWSPKHWILNVPPPFCGVHTMSGSSNSPLVGTAMSRTTHSASEPCPNKNIMLLPYFEQCSRYLYFERQTEKMNEDLHFCWGCAGSGGSNVIEYPCKRSGRGMFERIRRDSCFRYAERKLLLDLSSQLPPDGSHKTTSKDNTVAVALGPERALQWHSPYSHS